MLMRGTWVGCWDGETKVEKGRKEKLRVKRREGREGEGEEILKGGWMEGWGMRGTGGMSERDRAA